MLSPSTGSLPILVKINPPTVSISKFSGIKELDISSPKAFSPPDLSAAYRQDSLKSIILRPPPISS